MLRWIVVACLPIMLAGCIPTEDQVIQLGNDVDRLMVHIDDQQAKIGGQIDKVQEHVILVNDAIKAAESLPEKAAAGIEASRPFNPYADEMAIILAGATAVGGLFMRKQGKEAAVVAAKYQAHKVGVERAMMSAEPATAAAVYDAIGAARASQGM